MSIAENLAEVKDNIARAARKAGRKPEDITLIAVSKTYSSDIIKQAVDAGQTRFGENRVQEFNQKVVNFDKKIRWDIIGQLQKNKVKYIIDRVEIVHSLCTLSTAKEMQRLCERDDTKIKCLIELSIAGEEQKAGLTESELDGFLLEIDRLDRVEIRGLMTVAPFAEDAEQVRPVFSRMKKIFDEYRARGRDWDTLSMGMSGDYEIAIEEGATMVRVGSAIFGKRQ